MKKYHNIDYSETDYKYLKNSPTYRESHKIDPEIPYPPCNLYIKFVNKNLQLNLTIWRNGRIDIYHTDKWQDKHKAYISFKVPQLKRTPSKYFISLISEWFCELTEMPKYLIEYIRTY